MVILWDFFSVFPADAGMIPKEEEIAAIGEGVPRGCGDDPASLLISESGATCSPRMRG